METIVADWTEERKQDFFDSFASSPIMAALTDSGDPAAKMQVLLTLSDADLDSAMSLLIVLQSGDGKLMQQVRAADDASQTAQTDTVREGGKSQAMHGMVAALSSLDTMRRFQQQQQQQIQQHAGHGHDHSHGHEHGPSCNHHAPPPRQDVSKNSNSTMER